MGKNPLDFCKKVTKKIKSKYKNREIKLATILVVIMGCFFYGNYIKNALFNEVKAKEMKVIEMDNLLGIDEDWQLSDVKNKNLALFLSENKKEIVNKESSKFEDEIKDIIKDYPIEEMAPYIAKYDKRVAALIVGIAKKESNWGLHAPSKNGKTCYNYWGYKGAGSQGVSLGYGCFGSPDEAVDAIGGRISELVDKNIDTPAKMVVWKCGSSCAGHDPLGVKKWISDVNLYYAKINKLAS
jgi:hypothetical protein